MAGQLLATAGDSQSLQSAIKGPALKGRLEKRIALVGRSNGGKSSLINALVRARIAHVSVTPGKTRNLHFYLWQDARKILVDLPGYGYAKAGMEERERWERFIQEYLQNDEGLERAIVVLDARHGPLPGDVEAIRFLASQSIPITIVFTKADTLKTQSERVMRRREAGALVRELGYDPEAALWVSARTRDGLHLLEKELRGAAAPTVHREGK